MKPFVKHTGLVAPLDRVNVDTDQMVPKQFCKLLTREGYGKFLFYDWRYQDGDVPDPEFVLNRPRYRGASILLTRANLGCGSSREHAAWAVHDYGFRAVIAPSFADIFYSNCFKNSILPVRLPDAEVEELFRRTDGNQGYRLTVDLEQQAITDEGGLKLRFEVDPARKQRLLQGLDDIGLTLLHEEKISAYEKKHNPQAGMYDASAVDVKFASGKTR
ncbi:3-isopropylmalate dehydratase small subunit [Acidobacteriia bacterium AH_259_A11_L15]|nr:3-isopropylmalate dehydratase small subunit [Acidobacteriia bacterium AH_259_A11_L15]